MAIPMGKSSTPVGYTRGVSAARYRASTPRPRGRHGLEGALIAIGFDDTLSGGKDGNHWAGIIAHPIVVSGYSMALIDMAA
jgi:hypothetical protein